VTALVVDASVWVAAADATDPFSEPSRRFLETLAAEALPIALPALARIEVACALARRLRDAPAARRIADRMVRSPLVSEHVLDVVLVDAAVTAGTGAFLRAADAIYLALARSLGAAVVTWDGELIQRAGALTPADWLAASSRKQPHGETGK
jgi:predicted nucleic acid-binding protein